MKLKWKGIYKNEEQILIGDLPENAVKFKEPNTPSELSSAVCIYIIPVIILVCIAALIKPMYGFNRIYLDAFDIWGILLALLMIVPHEILHALVLPKDAEANIWFYPKGGMAFVHFTCPISKSRFIILSLLPSIIFGLLPLIVWLFIPVELKKLSSVLFSFAFFGLLFGVGDYLNVFNAARQMPKGSYTQLYGFNSYWFLP